MLKNGQAYFKNIAVWASQDFQSIFGHFPTLHINECVKSKANHSQTDGLLSLGEPLKTKNTSMTIIFIDSLYKDQKS